MNEIDWYLLRLRRRIRTRGWMVQGVLPGPRTPPFQYTVGLSPKAGFEILIIGLSQDIGATVLNGLVSRVVRGTRFTHGEILTDVLANGYAVTMLELADASAWITVCCPALKMPMGEALWVPMVWARKPRRVLLRRGFRRCGVARGRLGAGGVSRRPR